ncbi:MAG: ligase-associated DNA damage response exonuclease [Bdellovibrionota bacterium]
MTESLTLSPYGLYSPAGDFFIDPSRPRGVAFITHAHADHARSGASCYYAHKDSTPFLQHRLGSSATIVPLEYGETVVRNGVTVSLHPAGHILGSSQVRVEYQGHVTVVTGDYKLTPDSTCAPFEHISCDHFITEATFALPIYHWQADELIFEQIRQWWRENRLNGKTSILYAYALGKAQRILAGLIGEEAPIGLHGAILPYLSGYRQAGVHFPEIIKANSENTSLLKGEGLIIAPPSACDSPWTRKFAPYSQGFASGWMQIRGKKRQRRGVEHGFVLSDHADWQGLLTAIHASQAHTVSTMHGEASALIRYLTELGIDACPLTERFQTSMAKEG